MSLGIGTDTTALTNNTTGHSIKVTASGADRKAGLASMQRRANRSDSTPTRIGLGSAMAKPTVREKIVAAAQERFHTLGYNACGVQEIVDAAGVPKGSFYNYFKAKELLAREVLNNYWAGGRLDVLADKTLPPLERLRQHFEHIASRYKKVGFENGCLV